MRGAWASGRGFGLCAGAGRRVWVVHGAGAERQGKCGAVAGDGEADGGVEGDDFIEHG